MSAATLYFHTEAHDMSCGINVYIFLPRNYNDIIAMFVVTNDNAL